MADTNDINVWLRQIESNNEIESIYDIVRVACKDGRVDFLEWWKKWTC